MALLQPIHQRSDRVSYLVVHTNSKQNKKETKKQKKTNKELTPTKDIGTSMVRKETLALTVPGFYLKDCH